MATNFRTTLSPLGIPLLDSLVIMLLCGVVVGGTVELFQALTTADPPRVHGGWASGHAVVFDGSAVWTRQQFKPVRFTEIREGAFTTRWLQRLCCVLAAGVLAVVLSYFAANRLQRRSLSARPFLPRVAAAIACISFLAAQFVWVYSLVPDTYSHVNGREVHLAMNAGWNALFIAAMGASIMAILELTIHFKGLRRDA
jgi:hypothetical protein